VNGRKSQRCYWKGHHLRQPRAKGESRTDKGIAKDVEKLKVVFTTGDPGGARAKGAGDRMRLSGLGTSKTSESKVSVMRMVGD